MLTMYDVCPDCEHDNDAHTADGCEVVDCDCAPAEPISDEPYIERSCCRSCERAS